MVCLRVKRIPVRNAAAGFPCLPRQLYDPLHTGVNVSLRQLSFRHGPLHVLIKHSVAAWHFQVTARLKRPDAVIHRAPVCDDQPLESPLIPQDISQEPFIVTGKSSVYLVVGAHHGIRLPLLHRHLESGQIDLAQRALIHHAVPHHAVLLLIVRRIMF